MRFLRLAVNYCLTFFFGNFVEMRNSFFCRLSRLGRRSIILAQPFFTLDDAAVVNVVDQLPVPGFGNDFGNVSFIIYGLVFVGIVLVIVVLSFILAPREETYAKIQPYECGFEPFGEDAHGQFEVHFYIVGILFLVFDLEIVFLFPWLFSFVENTSFFVYNFFSVFVFLLLLGVGFVYEWSTGVLDWSLRRDPRAGSNE